MSQKNGTDASCLFFLILFILFSGGIKIQIGGSVSNAPSQTQTAPVISANESLPAEAPIKIK